MKTVLIVDDSDYMRAIIREHLDDSKFEVIGEAGTGDEAIELALELEPDIITMDNILPDMMGSDITRILIQEEELDSKIIMISAVGQESAIKEGLANRACAYLVKPFDSADLIKALNS